MKRMSSWILGATIAVLAGSDWFAGTAPAGGNDSKGVAFGKATITAVTREVEQLGKKELHAFLAIKGDADGTVKVRLQETPYNPMSRMPARPKEIWTRDITIDTKKSAELDLGVVPALDKKMVRSLTLSVDGKLFSRLLVWGGGQLDTLDE